MDLSRRYSRRSPNPLIPLNPLQIPELDDETASISSIQPSFQDISPILPQQSPLLHALSNAQKREPLPSSRWLRKPLNGSSFKGQSEHRVPTINNVTFPATNLGTDVLRRSVSERIPKRDSGVALDLDFDSPNGLHNAKISARAMDRAMRSKERSRPDPRYIQPRSQVTQRRYTNVQRSNAVRPSLRRNQNFISLPHTAGLNQEQAKAGCIPGFSSLLRPNHDQMASEFRNIEEQDESTQRRGLDDHLHKIFNVERPPLSEGPGKEVQFVVKTGRKERGLAAQFRDAGADNEMKGSTKKRGLWERVKGWVKKWKGKRVTGQ